MLRHVMIVGAALLGLVAGGIHLTEPPRLVAAVEPAGVPAIGLTLVGSVLFFCGILILLPRTRAAGAVVQACAMGGLAWVLWQAGLHPEAMVWAALILPVLMAGFWRADGPRRVGPSGPNQMTLRSTFK